MMSLGALAGIPAALLIYAWTRKQPNASDFVKKLWKYGRELIAISAILNILFVFIPLLSGKVSELTTISWLQLTISGLILPVIYKSGYIKDCFSEFPESENR